jgi:hypothetical protein
MLNDCDLKLHKLRVLGLIIQVEPYHQGPDSPPSRFLFIIGDNSAVSRFNYRRMLKNAQLKVNA